MNFSEGNTATIIGVREWCSQVASEEECRRQDFALIPYILLREVLDQP
jgi:hypothetical protein